MDKEIIKIALESAYQLLSDEIQTIEFKELREEYLHVIQQLKDGLDELQKDI